MRNNNVTRVCFAAIVISTFGALCASSNWQDPNLSAQSCHTQSAIAHFLGSTALIISALGFGAAMQNDDRRSPVNSANKLSYGAIMLLQYTANLCSIATAPDSTFFTESCINWSKVSYVLNGISLVLSTLRLGIALRSPEMGM